MKGIMLLISLLFVMNLNAYAQTEKGHSSGRNHLFSLRNVSATGAIADIGYLNMPIGRTIVHGAVINMGAVLNDHFATGLAMEVAGTKELAMETPIQPINPQYRYFFFGWNNEYLIVPEKLINASVQVKSGFVNISYHDRAEHTLVGTGNSVAAAPRELASDGFFVLQPGVNLFANITSFMSFGVGGNYRFAWGVDGAGNENDFNNYTWNATLRFVIDSDAFEEEE